MLAFVKSFLCFLLLVLAGRVFGQIPSPPQTFPPEPYSYFLSWQNACNCDEYGQKSIVISTHAPEGVDITDFENSDWSFVGDQELSFSYPVPAGKCITVSFWLVKIGVGRTRNHLATSVIRTS